MKRILLLLIFFCAICFGFWMALSTPGEAVKTEQETYTDTALTISVKNELKEVMVDSVSTPSDSIAPETK